MSGIPWRELAACSGLAPMWDAAISDDADDHRETRAARAERHKRAAEVCGRCPVAVQCVADTGKRDEGMRGGVLLPPLVFNTPRRGPGEYSEAPHGSAAAERAHYRRHESLCDRCRVESYQRKKKREAS